MHFGEETAESDDASFNVWPAHTHAAPLTHTRTGQHATDARGQAAAEARVSAICSTALRGSLSSPIVVSRRRSVESWLIVLIVWAFAIVCVGTYFFLPDMKASLGQVCSHQHLITNESSFTSSPSSIVTPDGDASARRHRWARCTRYGGLPGCLLVI